MDFFPIKQHFFLSLWTLKQILIYVKYVIMLYFNNIIYKGSVNKGFGDFGLNS